LKNKNKLQTDMNRLTIATVLIFIAYINAQLPPGEDYCISGYDIGICGSARFAGAIDYLAWNNLQFINKYDHGRQLQIAITNQNGECFNPTEAGSLNDGTSYSTSSQLLGVNTDNNIYRTTTNPAFWLAPGQPDAQCGTAVNTAITSNYQTSKAISIGYMGEPRAILFLISAYIPDNQPYIQVEAPTGYLDYNYFNYFYTINLATGVLSGLNINTAPNEGPDPVIIATNDGSHAIGAFLQSTNGAQYASYARYAFPSNVPGAATSKWSVVNRNSGGIAAGTTLQYTSVICVGTLQIVQSCMYNVAQQTGFVYGN